MNEKFKRVFPPSQRQLFDGGLNNKYERSIIEDNESPDCANVIFSAGSVGTRQGATKLNTLSVGSVSFDGLATRRDNTGAETLCAFIGSHMFTLATTTFVTVPSAQSVFTIGARVATALENNYMFIGNGGVIPYKYDGLTFTRHGVYPPTTTATVASNGVGALSASADYRYKITFVNSQAIESDVGPVTATFTISSTSGQNRLSAIPVAPTSWGVNTRNIYRTLANGTTFKRVASLADNTTTTYDDNVTDTALGVTAPTDNGVPPKYSVLVYHQTRLFMNDAANPNFVWYSEVNQPYTVASSNFFRIGDNASDLIKGFGVYENALVVFCERSIWLVYMADSTPANWKQIRVKSPHGSKSPFGIVEYNNKQLFPAVQNGKFVGFGALRGDVADTSTALLTVFAAGSELKSDRIEPEMFNIQESYLNLISGIVYKNRAYFAVPYGSGITANNRIEVFDFSIEDVSKRQEAAWCPWTGLKPAQFAIYNGNLYFSTSDNTGFVYQLESGVYNDNGAAIDSYFWTKEFSGQKDEYNTFKDWRWANLLIDTPGNYYMNVTYRADSDSGSGTTTQVILTPGGSLWGVMAWGVDTWGGGTTQKEVRIYFGALRGKRIQLKFSNQNTVNQRFKVHGLNLVYNARGVR